MLLDLRQLRYNTIVSKCRNCVERAIGAMKLRWRIPCHYELRSLDLISEVVQACASLHNFCVRRNLSQPDQDEEVVNFWRIFPDEQTSNAYRHYYCNKSTVLE